MISMTALMTLIENDAHDDLEEENCCLPTLAKVFLNKEFLQQIFRKKDGNQPAKGTAQK
jgi:hypothetical protein